MLFDPVVPGRASDDLRRSLLSRLTVVGGLLLGADETAELGSRGAGVLADALARQAKSRATHDELWLVLIGLTAAFPTVDLVLAARRALAVAGPETALAALLDAAYRSGRRFDSLGYEIEIETVSAVADVDFCARFDHNTGIQRVVRETMSRWSGVHDVRFACWSEGDGAFRELSALEHRRVVDWNAYRAEERAGGGGAAEAWVTGAQATGARATGAMATKLIVPWQTTVLLPEVAHAGLWPQLAALARFSGNRVAMIGYDTIPIGSADLIMPIESEKFAKYLTIVKHATRIAAISETAAEEFAGFVSAAGAQGVEGPHVGCVTLAVQVPGGEAGAAVARAGTRTAQGEKLVLVVGNQEPRKNLLAVLFAAETLWREGSRFRLRMIGGGRPDYVRTIDREVARLRRAGRPVEVLRGASDDVLVASYRDAWFTLFPSIHEGYGLPVAESLAMGVPSITSDFGSTQQIADGGGCLTVDPRDDESIIRGMRRLLDEPGLRERLAGEALAREPRTWDHYADELWHELLEPLEAHL